MENDYLDNYFRSDEYLRDFPELRQESKLTTDEVIINKVKISAEDVQLSEALSAFQVFPETIRSAIWDLASQPTALCMQVLETFVHTDVIQSVKRGNINPVAHAGIVQRTASVVKVRKDDLEFDQIERVLLKMSDEVFSQPIAVETLSENGPEIKTVVNRTVLEAHFVQSMYLSASRLSLGNEANLSRYLDLQSGLCSTTLSFDNFLLVKDTFRTLADPQSGLSVIVFGHQGDDCDVKATTAINQLLLKAMAKRPIIKVPFKDKDFEHWRDFLNAMNESRDGFSNMLMCIAYPFIVDFLIKLYSPIPDLEEIDQDLPTQATILVDEFSLQADDKDETTDLYSFFRDLNNEFTPEVLVNMEVKDEDYGSFIIHGQDAYSNDHDELEEKINLIPDPFKNNMSEKLFSFLYPAVKVSEILRVVRAQDDYDRDENTNRAADIFQGHYEQIHYSYWVVNAENLLGAKIHRIYLIGDISSFPFLKNIVGLDCVTKTDFSLMNDVKPEEENFNYFFCDLVNYKFDSLDDESIRTRYYKTWMKAFQPTSIAFSIFLRISTFKKLCEKFKVKNKRCDIFLRLPIPSSLLLMKYIV